MSNSIHFEQLFERFSRVLDREFRPAGERRRGSMGEDWLSGAGHHSRRRASLSQNTLTAYRRTWVKRIALVAAEGVRLKPCHQTGREFYEEATRGRSASHHHLQVKAPLALLYDVLDATDPFAECRAPKFSPEETELRYHTALQLTDENDSEKILTQSGLTIIRGDRETAALEGHSIIIIVISAPPNEKP
jgi:hypothetical protein